MLTAVLLFYSSSAENGCKAALLPAELYAAALVCTGQACKGLTAAAQLGQELGSEGSLDSLTDLVPCSGALLQSLMRRPLNVLGAQVSQLRMGKALHLCACASSRVGCSQEASDSIHLQVKPTHASLSQRHMRAFNTNARHTQTWCQNFLRCMNGMTCPQDMICNFAPAVEALKWEGLAGALQMAAAAPAKTPASAAGTMQVALLTETVQALQTADSQSLLPLLQCLRSANAIENPQAMAKDAVPCPRHH